MDIGKLIQAMLFIALLATAVTIPYVGLTSRYGVASNSTQFTQFNNTVSSLETKITNMEAKVRAVQSNPVGLIVAPALVIDIAIIIIDVMALGPQLVTTTANTIGIPSPIPQIAMLILTIGIVIAIVKFVVGRQEGQGL